MGIILFALVYLVSSLSLKVGTLALTVTPMVRAIRGKKKPPVMV
jgi:hypothetical protein